MASLALHVLGSPRVELDGEPVAIERRKALALLVYLAVTRQDHSRDSLATLFWSEYDQSRARGGLRSALWSLTKALGEGHLDIDRESVRFKPDADAWLDVDEFQDRLEECRTHGHPPNQVCPDCLSALSEAAAVYKGDFMAGFTLADSPGFDEWQFFQCEGLRQGLAGALERLARGHGDRGEYEQAITHARRWAALDPLHEPAQRLMMRLYSWSGQRAAALRQYAECQRVLQEDLGAPPDEETIQLYKVIKERGELPPPTKCPTTPAVARAARPKHNLPVQLTPFVGRTAALAAIADLLQDPACRLLTLVGPGGSGKTRLALQAAAGQLDNYPHGVFFVSLAPLDSADAILPAVAQAIGFRFYEGGQPQQQLLRYLREKRMLILMDNFEHLLDPPPSVPPTGAVRPAQRSGDGRERGGAGGAQLVAAILTTAPEVKILATSRARLNMQGEHLLPVPGMDVPDPESAKDAALRQAQEIARYSAVRLFLQSARRAQPAFALTADNSAHVARICRRVAGMPLGILLAAAWVGMLTPAEIAEQISGEIGRGLDFLETDLQDVPQRQRSMRAVFDHSWSLLSEQERKMMQGLSVFRGGFTHQAAQQVTGASLRQLRALVDRSLLQRASAPSATLRTGGRYEIHELLRQYAAGHLAGVPEAREAVKDRHCTYYVDYLQQRETALLGRGQRKALAEIEVEFENVRAAWNWALAQGKVEELDRCLESLTEFYRVRGWYQEGEETFARAVQRLEEELEPAATGVQADFAGRKATSVLGKVLLRQGQFCGFLGFKEKASELLQQSLAISRDLGARREIAWALRWLGFIAFSPEEGRRLCLEALVILEEIGDQMGIAYSLWGLGDVATIQGRYSDAKQLYQEYLTIIRELGHQSGIAYALLDLGGVHWALGEYGMAKQLDQEALALLKEIDDSWGVGWALQCLAVDTFALQEYEEAKQLFQESLAIRREIGNPRRTQNVLGSMGELANALGEHAEAIRFAQESLALSEKHDTQERIAFDSIVLGEALCGLGNLQAARRHIHQALETSVTIRWSHISLLTLLPIAILRAAQEEKEQALELLALVLHHPASWQWTKDRAAPLVAELEAELPPDIVAAALERGQARDLDATLAELLVELAPDGVS